ncbi:hypothetical protein WAI453_004681 [Rhynchosporium graminicola]|uniref:Uncharacterized protein n=1 Tax=Rhynchosporium graminicola TaxID=2792576 RepID=A0A1E1LGK1_9HELO|nr:uncharacterized protein RCO7_03741 [Rhynchosporium commune]
MPPSISRTSLNSLGRCICPAKSIPLRSFSTTPSLAGFGPEHPKFIEIPTPPQHQASPKLNIKGTLPPPRNIFPRRAGDKTSPEYLAAVTPEPSSQAEPQNEFVAWKRRMAESRRTNLREGLVALHQRKMAQDMNATARSRNKSAKREKALHAPKREDERLTNPTVTELNRTLQSGAVPDPDRASRVAKKIARVEAIALAKKETRRDALHTLYMNARSFITSEDELDAEIEKIFVDNPHPGRVGDDIWAAMGAPPAIQGMLSVVNNTQKTALDFHSPPALLTGRRMKKIAQELTGGTMDGGR